MASDEGFAITGSITIDEVFDALKKSFPDRDFAINNDAQIVSGRGSDVIISPLRNYTKALEKKLEERNKEFSELEATASKAGLSIQALNKQQLALYDEFVLLRQRYDEQKSSLVNILWTHCTKHHPDLRCIPTMEDMDTFAETDEKVGHLHVGAALGEGQFATVMSCTRDGTPREYALKIIKKEKITSFASLQRVSNEIDNLKLLHSPHVVTISEVMHTATKLYIVTEKGGFDLFEFFDEHPNGVSETWAREIVVCILKGVLYCHDQGICHRDLKPENILLKFDTAAGRCEDLKLCDFGLSTKFKPKVLLTDFCGSPGFFAPEMIIHGAYYGDKADVWSIGCILLELVMGHEKFCDCWMTAYDYEVLQDKEQFTASIEDTTDELASLLTFSPELNDFVLKFLELRSTKRPNVRNLCAHPWLHGLMDAELAAMRVSSLLMSSSPSRCASPSQSFIMDPADAPDRSHNISQNQEAIKVMYNNLSEKERRQMEEYILNHKQQQRGDSGIAAADGRPQMSLPPIIPQTPSVKNAKKIMRKGNELVNSNTLANSGSHAHTSNGHSNGHSNNSNGSNGHSSSHPHLKSCLMHDATNHLHSSSHGHMPPSLSSSRESSNSGFESPAAQSSAYSHFSPSPSPQGPWGSSLSPGPSARNLLLPKVVEASGEAESGALSVLTSPHNERREGREGTLTPRSAGEHKEGMITPRGGGRQLLVSFSEKLLVVEDSPRPSPRPPAEEKKRNT